MKFLTVCLSSLTLVLASNAETVCLGHNCNSDTSLEEAYMAIGEFHVNMARSRFSGLNASLADDPDEDYNECVNRCEAEFSARMRGCNMAVGVQNDDISKQFTDACYNNALKELTSCLQPIGFGKCPVPQ